ncbi:MAG TPA: hypothetical protein VGK10_06745 [Prolixibacteraceae bacterium]|jgi:hypothetical protein
MEEKEENKFMNKYGFLVVVLVLIVVFSLLKLIGFPDFLYK